MAFGAQPDDSANIPLSTVYSKENNTFPALAAEPGAYKDSNSNQSSAAIMSFIRPLIVQKNHSVTGAGGKTLTCAFSNNNIAGNSIIVALGMGEVDNGTTITLAVTDSQTNTYTSAVKASQSTTLEAAIFYATNVAAGANTVTITIAGGSSSNTAIAVEIYEVWGLVAPTALDQAAIGSNAGSTTPSTGVVDPIVPNELVFAAISAAGGTITAGTGWTLDSGTLSPTGGNLVKFGVQSQSLSTSAALTPSATLSGSNAWAMAAACFKSIILPVEGTVSIAPTYVEQANLSVAALNADLVPVTDVSAYKYLSLHITGAWSGFVSFLVSNDNVDWSNSVLLNFTGGFGVYAGANFNGMFTGPISFRYFRAKVTSYSAGTVTGTLELYQSDTALASVGAQANIQLVGGANLSLGRNTMANSLPVTLASDQPTVNADITCYASAARTASPTAMADQTNIGAKGLKVVVDATVNAGGAGSITMTIQGKDAASGKYYTILASAAIVTVTTNVYTVYPTITAVANSIAQDALPTTWRVIVTANNANSVTYSVGASYLA